MYEQLIFTKNRMHLILFICLAFSTCTINAYAQETGEWVAAEITRSLPNQENISGRTYLSKKFAVKTGTFMATYKSVLDKRNKVSGKFIVGKFRYVYDKPMGEQDSDIFPIHDEQITTVILDCINSFVGTFRSEYILNGKKVLENINSDQDIEMVQMNISNTTIGDLCAFAKKQGVW